ncbi:pentatricopeptide repeat-containing protein At3g02330, mitochondrial isoform X1 [Selaginella moellendorffii]|uniref:pentatricopeptide repeat-containing protein At3g02330, mitochondrial isoform X1 n=1 Tax=Selaginella moellendorffii TaxID=88036 RepID=UPI000D1CF80A|nr:pentatricopeptide repeat-containing protein At3g02330, mitochondrial isoform X1 [Selaginella moellendorffii]|eukprot:XP_024533273.1 pentatricopeptide repeat-containing protein At3g02330, mitochondrial isoform X1 [Selaginella moellendorffii]
MWRGPSSLFCRYVASEAARFSVHQSEGAIQEFDKLRDSGVAASTYILLASLKACSSSRDIQAGMRIHAYVTESGDDRDLTVANTLVHMYARCGKMWEARMVFDSMAQRSLVSWNAVMFGYAEAGDAGQPLNLLRQMQADGFRPNSLTYMAVLKACAACAAEQGKEPPQLLLLETGKAIHSECRECGHEEDPKVASTLVDMYAKCRSMVDARRVFDGMKHRSLVAWNSLLFGYADSGQGELALQLFARMQDEGHTPDARSYVAAVKACGCCAEKEEWRQVGGSLVVKLAWLDKGMALHSQVSRCGDEGNTIVANTLLHMYVSCGSLEDARKVFDKMPRHSVLSWNGVMAGCWDRGDPQQALEMTASMQDYGLTPNAATYVAALKACVRIAGRDGLSKGRAVHAQAKAAGLEADRRVSSTLVNMYAKCGSMVDACRVFDGMMFHDVVSWNGLILGYVDVGEAAKALECYARMQQQGSRPDALTFVAVLKACAHLSHLEAGKRVHEHLCSRGVEQELTVANSLVDFYGKAGSMHESRRIFECMGLQRDVVTWNALMAGYAQQGDAQEVVRLFDRMQQQPDVRPNSITFLCVIKACSHAGLVDTGKHCFDLMQLGACLVPGIEHYSALLDLLARANRLDDALALLTGMPCAPDQAMWMTVLTAARKWSNLEVARVAFESIARMREEDSAAYVVLANTYAAAGDVPD